VACAVHRDHTIKEEVRMRKGVALLVAMAALVFTSTAVAAYAYAGPRYWYPGEAAGGSWSSGVTYNGFNKATSGYDTTVTFIDNVSYGWNATVRNSEMVTYTRWWSNQVKKPHCRAHRGYHWGGCHVD
jgi:hypothetical protein